MIIEFANSCGADLAGVLRGTELEFCDGHPLRCASLTGRGKSDDIESLVSASEVLGKEIEALAGTRIRDAMEG